GVPSQARTAAARAVVGGALRDEALFNGDGASHDRPRGKRDIVMDEWVRVPFEVEKKFDGLRVDRFLAQRLASYSRSRVQKILSSARVQKGERIIRASTKVYAGDKITIA